MPINPQAFGQQTIAAQWAQSKRNGSTGGKRSARKRRAKAKPANGKRKRRASAKRPARLVKGSAAAKRYMAKIRRKRR